MRSSTIPSWLSADVWSSGSEALYNDVGESPGARPKSNVYSLPASVRRLNDEGPPPACRMLLLYGRRMAAPPGGTTYSARFVAMQSHCQDPT